MNNNCNCENCDNSEFCKYVPNGFIDLDLGRCKYFKGKPKRAYWKVAYNPSYSPFDDSPEDFYICSNCGNREPRKKDICHKCFAIMDLQKKECVGTPINMEDD